MVNAFGENHIFPRDFSHDYYFIVEAAAFSFIGIDDRY